MTDNKLTDEQIIKALECCCKEAHELIDGWCNGCPMDKLCDEDADALIKYALDLINRKDKRIEELQLKNSELEIELKAMRGAANSYKTETEILQKAIKVQDIMIEQQDYKLKTAKSEAIKEFAERLQAKAFRFCGNDYRTILEDDLYTVLEEMVGEQDV